MSPVNLRCLVSHAIFLLAIMWFLPATRAVAQEGMNTDSILVRSRLPLPGGPVQQMFLEESGGRKYLYLKQAREGGYIVVDVTDDRHPKTIKEIASQHRGEPETLEMVGNELGVAVRRDNPLNHGPSSIEEVPASPTPHFVRLLDLSDASHPRTLKTFDGVTSLVLDDRHNMIYLTNGDGLWVLHHRIDLMRQFCLEESQYEVGMLCTGY